MNATQAFLLGLVGAVGPALLAAWFARRRTAAETVDILTGAAERLVTQLERRIAALERELLAAREDLAAARTEIDGLRKALISTDAHLERQERRLHKHEETP